MLREYDCWLQKRRINIDFDFPKIICSDVKGEIGKQAVNELCLGIKRLLDIKLKVIKTKEKKQNAIILSFASSASFALKNTDNASASFALKILCDQVIITASGENGLLYGVLRFLSLLALGKIKPGFELTDAPASRYRIINHWDNFDGSIERGYAGDSIFYKDGFFNFDKKRIEDYARMLASVGINYLSINNVNVRAQAKLLITEKYLKQAKKLAAIFRKFGIKLLFSINFGAPYSLGKLPAADPLDPAVIEWWKKRAALIYKHIPDLAGFLVKADSEGEPGPFQYGRSHADGANMLARALAPFGGEVIWRCFVYNCAQDWRDHSVDRARSAFDNFMPLDGKFDSNVILQIKHSPLDFQVREPVSPLFGALKKTRHIMELQITQEYTGHQIDLCYLPYMWEDILTFDTCYYEKSKINEIVSFNSSQNSASSASFALNNSSFFEGFAAVVNVGLDNNWTGHSLAQANLYGYGRMSWNPALSARETAEEWSALSFGEETNAARKITDILLRSYPAYEKYNAPFGVCFMVTPGSHYGPNIEGYEFSRWGTYHRADKDAIGIDRTPSGTGFSALYSEKNAALFSDPRACPENMILFFHRLRYDFIMKNGKSLLQNIYDNHFDGYEEAARLKEDWEKLKPELEPEVYESVLSRFKRQLENAREWRDQINTYFFRKTGVADGQGRKIYE